MRLSAQCSTLQHTSRKWTGQGLAGRETGSGWCTDRRCSRTVHKHTLNCVPTWHNPYLEPLDISYPFEDWLNQGCKDFISSNLKTRGDRRMSRNKFQTDSPQIFGVIVTNRSPQRTYAWDLCTPGLDCSESYRLVTARPSGKDTPGTWYSVETWI